MEQRKRKRGLIHYPVLILFSLFFVGMFLLDCVTPDRAVSELENKTLTQRPAVTAQILTPAGLNSFFNNYSQYTKDQVPGRDAWISLQSFVETALLQKTQSGGVLLGGTPAHRRRSQRKPQQQGCTEKPHLPAGEGAQKRGGKPGE